MAVNYSQYSASRARALDRLGESRRRQLEAEADAKIAKSRQADDMSNLLNLGIQAGAAYLTGGASLAYGGLMNQALMGGKQGWSRDVSNLGQAAYGMGKANMAQSLADADQQFAKKQASDERMYNMALEMGDYEGAAEIAQSMNSAVSQYDKDRKGFKEEGFLPHLFQSQTLERSAVPSNIQMRPTSIETPSTDQLNVRPGNYTSQMQNNEAVNKAMDEEMIRRERERVERNMREPSLMPFH